MRSTDSRMVVIGGVDPHDRVSNQLYAINGDLSKSEFLPPMHEGLCRLVSYFRSTLNCCQGKFCFKL